MAASLNDGSDRILLTVMDMLLHLPVLYIGRINFRIITTGFRHCYLYNVEIEANRLCENYKAKADSLYILQGI